MIHDPMMYDISECIRGKDRTSNGISEIAVSDCWSHRQKEEVRIIIGGRMRGGEEIVWVED